MTDYSDFSDAPVSIGEARSEKERDASKWTVRDLLVSMLRDIDNGIAKPSKAILVYMTDDGKETRYLVSSDKSTTIIGMMEQAKYALLTR